MSEILIIAAIVALGHLGIQGWKHDKRWARIAVWVILIAVLLIGAVAAYFIAALSQTNWSL